MTWQALEEHMREIRTRRPQQDYPECLVEVALVLHDEWLWPMKDVAAALGVHQSWLGRVMSEHYEARRKVAQPGYMKVWRPAA